MMADKKRHMFDSKFYKIVTNPEKRVYELINIESGYVEAEDKAFPKMLVALREFERQIGLSLQERKSNVTLLEVSRPDNSV